MKKLLLFLLPMLPLAGVDAQTKPDKRFQLGLEGGIQFGVRPFHHSQQASLNGSVTCGSFFGINGAFPIGGAPRWVIGMQFRAYNFLGPDGAKEALLYRRFSTPDFYTLVRTGEVGTSLRQFGVTVGYRLAVPIVDLTVTLGINSGYFGGGESYSIYRKQKQDNYSEEITINGSGNESNPITFLYPSLAVSGAYKLYRWLYVTAAVSGHAGTAAEVRYTVRRDGLFGERSDETFTERQSFLHTGGSIGLQWRIGSSN